MVGCPVSQKNVATNRAGFTVMHLLQKVYRIRTSCNSDSCATVTPLQTVSVRGHGCIPKSAIRVLITIIFSWHQGLVANQERMHVHRCRCMANAVVQDSFSCVVCVN